MVDCAINVGMVGKLGSWICKVNDKGPIELGKYVRLTDFIISWCISLGKKMLTMY